MNIEEVVKWDQQNIKILDSLLQNFTWEELALNGFRNQAVHAYQQQFYCDVLTAERRVSEFVRSSWS